MFRQLAINVTLILISLVYQLAFQRLVGLSANKNVNTGLSIHHMQNHLRLKIELDHPANGLS